MSTTPRTDAAVNAGGNQLLNVATGSRLLETELQQAQAALAASQAELARTYESPNGRWVSRLND